LQASDDFIIFERADAEGRVIISADTDFSFLLSQRRTNKPSIILFRKGSERNPFRQIELLKLNLTGSIINQLEDGSVLIIEEKRIRIRTLPIIKK
jgi:predicted nuclease of predicted toxin-antitoxin system